MGSAGFECFLNSQFGGENPEQQNSSVSKNLGMAHSSTPVLLYRVPSPYALPTFPNGIGT
jgi:hypothetical protein